MEGYFYQSFFENKTIYFEKNTLFENIRFFKEIIEFKKRN